nr:cytochrome C oxidase subunit II [Sphingomonas sp.]
MFEGWPPPILDPAGPYAGSITTLSWILFAMAAGVLLVVLIALYLALFGQRELQTKLGGKAAIWLGGVAFPAVVLTILLIYGLSLTRHLSGSIEGTEPRVRIAGEMWWWRVAYLD